MRYLPNLIPQHARVLPEYFKGHVYAPARKPHPALVVLSYTGAVFFFLLALAVLSHPLITLLYAGMGFILLPPGHRLLERWLRFQLKPGIKALFLSVLFIGAMPLTAHYTAEDNKIAAQKQAEERVKTQQEQQEKALADEKMRQQEDSLNYYLAQSSTLTAGKKTEDALAALTRAEAFVAAPGDHARIARQRTDIAALKSVDLLNRKRYKEVIPLLDEQLQDDPGNDELLCKRALCYSKTGRMQEAVTDLKIAMGHGSKEAEKLHDKINPMRKRIVDHITRCCDGSTSYATGRGACSHHGGVCDWNEPVYEASRKYE